MRSSLRFCVFLLAAASTCSLSGMDRVRRELGIDQLHDEGIDGKGVLIGIMDRGIDWRNRDFRNADGTTRIDSIWDATGGRVSLFTRSQIDEALKNGSDLSTRDAVGHGTTTAGIAGGNGRNLNRYSGVAPKATFVVAKITGGAETHDDQPAEASFYDESHVIDAINYISTRARELDMPCVMLLNVGSIGGPTDASSTLARKIDATVGPGKKGLVFVTGPGDDGGRANHASGSIKQGETVLLRYWKDSTDPTVIDLWYPDCDRMSVSVESAHGEILCPPSAQPKTNAGFFQQVGDVARYVHLGSERLYFGSKSRRREVWFTIDGPPGEYRLLLKNPSTAVKDETRFHAFAPGNAHAPSLPPHNRFLSHIANGGSIWHGAAAKNNICPGDYVIRTDYVAASGRTVSLRNAGLTGELWKGSSVGPTMDGGRGVHICAPGDHIFTTYCTSSERARESHASNFIAVGGDWIYGRASAVSASAPVAAGVIALMLQANPELDATQVRDALCRTATQDRQTGRIPNPRWGFGKLNALSAVRVALNMAKRR